MDSRTTEKLEEYRARLQADPAALVFVPLADALRDQGEYDEALTVLMDGLEANPGSRSGRVVLGRTLLESGRDEEARRVLADALANDPENLVVLRLLAEDCRSRGAWADAAPYLEKLVDLRPDDPRWPAALAEAREFTEAPPATDGPSEPRFATMTLVDIYLAQGYHARAVAALRHMAEQQPERADVRRRLDTLAATETPPPAPAGEQDTTADKETAADKETGPATEATQRPRWTPQQRDQFAAWIEKISRNGDLGP